MMHIKLLIALVIILHLIGGPTLMRPVLANPWADVKWHPEVVESWGNFPMFAHASLLLSNGTTNYFVLIKGDIVEKVYFMGDGRIIASGKPQRTLPSDQLYWIWPSEKGYRVDVQIPLPPNTSFYVLTAGVSEKYHYKFVSAWKDRNLSNEIVRRAINQAQIDSENRRSYEGGWCLRYVSDLYESAGFPIRKGFSNAQMAGRTWSVSLTKEGIPPGAFVFFKWENDGHVGITLENGMIVHADFDGIIKQQTVSEIEGSNNSRQFLGWGYPTSY